MYELIVAESKASQNKIELAKMLKYVGEISPKVILQIGMRTGYTMVDFQKAFNPEIIIGIDNDLHPLDRDATSRFQILQGTSHDPAILEAVKTRLNDKLIDFLYINGDHTYDGVKKDYAAYSPFVRKGGIIGFDDIKLNGPKFVLAGIEVCRFWNELIGKTNAKYFEFWDQYEGGKGQGLFYKL